MIKTVLTYGLIGGLISCTGYMLTLNEMDFGMGMLVGFASMIVAFSLIFAAVKSYRDNYSAGTITFGKAFNTGLLVAFVASSVYVIAWLIAYYNFFPDFPEKYAESTIAAMKAKGASPAEISATSVKMEEFKEMYKNPVVVVLYSYVEIFPIGLLFALAAALVLKKKPQLAL